MAVKITVRNNGPYRVEGDDIQIVDQDGKPFGLAGRTAVSLCRCGTWYLGPPPGPEESGRDALRRVSSPRLGRSRPRPGGSSGRAIIVPRN